MKSFIFLMVSLFVSVSQAQKSTFTGSGMGSLHPYVGFGYADYNVTSPSSNFEMNKGVFAYVGAERFLNDDGTSITIAFNFMTTDGTAFYDYSTLGGARYTGSDVKFDSNNYQLSLGLRQRIFPSFWLRPYVEGGGLFGYHEIKYSGANIALTSGTGDANGFKKKDALTGLGYYGELGVEVDFSATYGVRVGGRYQVTETKEFDTLANQKIKFETTVFQLALLVGF